MGATLVQSVLLKSLLLGSALMVLTVFIHSWGTTTINRLLTRNRTALVKHFDGHAGFVALCIIVVFLLVLHVIQVVCWAIVYIKLADSPDISTFQDAVYFSMVTYTTLGYGDVTLTGDWRLLSGIQSMNGILLFGWSTALLFAVVQRIWAHDDKISR